MPAKLEKATKDVLTLITEVIEDHHDPLRVHGVTVQALMAYAPVNDENEKMSPALSQSGYPCNAIIRKTPLRERVMGAADAEIVFDGDTWKDLTGDQQRAIIDHELEHIIVVKKVSGEAAIDAHGRPKLGMRLHDVHLGWFSSVAKRHGANSAEVSQARSLVENHMDAYFPFASVSMSPVQEELE